MGNLEAKTQADIASSRKTIATWIRVVAVILESTGKDINLGSFLEQARMWYVESRNEINVLGMVAWGALWTLFPAKEGQLVTFIKTTIKSL